MAKKPDPAPPKRTGVLGAYRVEGGRFAAYDAEGKTYLVSETQAEALGIKEA